MEKGTILIIDDNETNGNMCRLYLETEGYSVYFAQDGQRGFEMAAEVKPDMVLLDLIMPVMDGYAFLENFRSHPALADVPVLVMTVMTDTSNVVKALQMGANDYLKKPFDADEFIARIKSLVRFKQDRDLMRKKSENILRQHHQLEGELKKWIREAKAFQALFGTSLPPSFPNHPPSPDDLNTALKATRHATSLINQVLTFGTDPP